MAVEMTAGVTLNAVEALARPQELWTTDQVAYACSLAFESGLRGRLEADLAEVRVCWLEAVMREKRRDRRAERLAYYEEQYAKLNEKMGRPVGYEYAGGPVEWPEVGTSDEYCANLRSIPARPARHLRVVA